MFGEVMGLSWGGLERRRQLAVGGGGSLVLDLVRGVGTLERSAGARVFCCLGVKRGFFCVNFTKQFYFANCTANFSLFLLAVETNIHLAESVIMLLLV